MVVSFSEEFENNEHAIDIRMSYVDPNASAIYIKLVTVFSVVVTAINLVVHLLVVYILVRMRTGRTVIAPISFVTSVQATEKKRIKMTGLFC